ncbi:hypothetical protein [Algoriphagus sp.]|uniref:hypothetical protein n=1 Tax=Algoriphagus sp. TaxID=1872435 RepID=UPI0025DAEF0A|nr:hypothetical protein [Algoriphagus sp.]
MKKFVLKSILYLAIALFIANVLAYMGLRILGKSDFFKTTYLVHHFPEGQSFDLAVFGSSRSLAAIDTKIIGETTGGLAVNFSMDYTALPSSLLMLEHFYAQGYTSEWVVISLDLPDFEESKTVISENDHRFLPYISNNYIREYFVEYEEAMLKPIAISKYVPVVGFAYYNMELLAPAVQALLRPSYKYRFDELGNYQYPDYLAQQEMPEARYFKTRLSNPILKEIAELTNKNGSKLIVYIAPYLRDDISVESPLDFLVINHSRLINEPKYFSDYIHVVNSGKVLATEAFIEDLRKIDNQP